jgi:hypothetical protein
MGILYKNDWMLILEEDEKYSIRYNSGDLVNSIKEIVVSKSDAIKAQKSDQNAYEVIIKYQNLQNHTNG